MARRAPLGLAWRASPREAPGRRGAWAGGGAGRGAGAGGRGAREARELRAAARLAGLDLHDEAFGALLELVRLDVVPNAIAQVLKSLCNKAHRAAPPGQPRSALRPS